MTETRLKNTGVRGWVEFDDFPMLRYNLPATFTLEGSIDSLGRGSRDVYDLIFGGDRSATPHFFSHDNDVRVKDLLKSPDGLIVRFEENAGGGRWRDAVYEIRNTGEQIWEASLLLHCGGKQGQPRCHNRYRLNGLKGRELSVSQLFLGGREQKDSVIDVFEDR